MPTVTSTVTLLVLCIFILRLFSLIFAVLTVTFSVFNISLFIIQWNLNVEGNMVEEEKFINLGDETEKLEF